MGTRNHPTLDNLCYFITTVVAGRRPVFRDHESAEMLIQAIQTAQSDLGFALLAFVVMPDHLHLLVVPAAGSTISDAVRAIKGRFAHGWNRRHHEKGPFWQARFFESGVRSSAQFRKWASYIDENLISEGLVSSAELYPYSSRSRPELVDVETFFSGSSPGQARSLAF